MKKAKEKLVLQNRRAQRAFIWRGKRSFLRTEGLRIGERKAEGAKVRLARVSRNFS